MSVLEGQAAETVDNAAITYYAALAANTIQGMAGAAAPKFYEQLLVSGPAHPG